MKKTIITSTALIAILLFLSVPASFADGHHGGKRGPNFCRLIDELKLTDEQLAQVKDIRVAKVKQLIDVKAELKKEMMEKRELWTDGIPSEKDVNKQISKISKIREDIAKIKAASKIKEMSVLTQEQLSELKKIKTKRFFQGKHHPKGCKGQHGDCSPGHKKHCASQCGEGLPAKACVKSNKECHKLGK
ncbi:MAG: Spy/CpxP family protein refolding chaperone [candidate division Zixibacteria bacterium]|nr:Spy/CpxP family protein refolding chaperone [candidate division Zixibacteria bacterium]